VLKETTMVDVQAPLAANRDAVADLVAAAERSVSAWTVPRAPGKWSASQIVEHVARSLEESANMVSGAPSAFPSLPFFLRPIVRRFLFNRVLRTGAFPKGRTNRAMNPASGPASPAEARARLEQALERFDRECRECAQTGGMVPSKTFGTVPVGDYARFIELHTRHHCRQMPAAAP
jgi:hypothetical protein